MDEEVFAHIKHLQSSTKQTTTRKTRKITFEKRWSANTKHRYKGEENMFDMIRERTQEYLRLHLMPQENKKQCEYTKVARNTKEVEPWTRQYWGGGGGSTLRCEMWHGNINKTLYWWFWLVIAESDLSLRWKPTDTWAIMGITFHSLRTRPKYPPNLFFKRIKCLSNIRKSMMRINSRTNMWQRCSRCVYVCGKGLRHFSWVKVKII